MNITSLKHKCLIAATIVFMVISLVGCAGLPTKSTPPSTNQLSASATLTPSPKPSLTRWPTRTPTANVPRTPTLHVTRTQFVVSTRTPGPTMTRYPLPYTPTATPLPPVPTPRVDINSSNAITDECRRAVINMNYLKPTDIPDHYFEGDMLRSDTDFDPNRYFDGFTHIRMAEGYDLDFVYFGDDLGGYPVLYARNLAIEPFKTYDEFLASYNEVRSGERSYGEAKHAFDFTEKVVLDESPASYFELLLLVLYGDQFYLSWHGLYNDAITLCSAADLQLVENELNSWANDGGVRELTPDIRRRMREIDFTPVVSENGQTMTVRYISFTKWGGFFENIFVFDKEHYATPLDSFSIPLVEYDCGFLF